MPAYGFLVNRIRYENTVTSMHTIFIQDLCRKQMLSFTLINY